MDVDQRHAYALEEVAREDLHVAGEDDQVGSAREELEHARLCLRLASLLDRHVLEGKAEGSDVCLEVRVVGDDEGDLGVELVAAPSPEQVEQAVILPRDEDRDALALAAHTKSANPSRSAAATSAKDASSWALLPRRRRDRTPSASGTSRPPGRSSAGRSRGCSRRARRERSRPPPRCPARPGRRPTAARSSPGNEWAGDTPAQRGCSEWSAATLGKPGPKARPIHTPCCLEKG